MINLYHFLARAGEDNHQSTGSYTVKVNIATCNFGPSLCMDKTGPLD